MPYTCVSGASGYGGVRIWGVTGVLSWWVCRVGGVTGCARGWRARAVGHRGATAGRPGERAAAASQAPSACARPAVGALLALSLQRGSLV